MDLIIIWIVMIGMLFIFEYIPSLLEKGLKKFASWCHEVSMPMGLTPRGLWMQNLIAIPDKPVKHGPAHKGQNPITHKQALAWGWKVLNLRENGAYKYEQRPNDIFIELPDGGLKRVSNLCAEIPL